MPLDLDPIRARLAVVNRQRWASNAEPAIDPRFPLGTFIAHAPADIAALLAEVERLRSELTGLRTYITRSIAADLAGVPEALEILDGLADEDMATVDQWIAAMSPRCQHDAELERLRADLLAQGEDNISLDRNLKDCVNWMRDLEPVIGADLNALRLEPDRAAAVETVRQAVCPEPRFIVRLEPGVWIAPWTGDPGRTTVKASARRFPTERSARRALSKARRFREFPKAVVECEP